MNRRDLLVKTLLVLLTFSLLGCNAQPISQPVLTPTETLAPIPPTETATSTSTPRPTITPTLVPTPLGGKNGLLLSQAVCHGGPECTQSIFLYDLVSHELVAFLDGYSLLDVSPDGKKALLKKKYWETGDLFILDLSQPEPMSLLQENVVEAVWLGQSDWIGFISVSKADYIRQVFLVHPDGSGLTQVTNSSIGAVELAPVFNNGVFWGEGTVASNGITKNIRQYKWTNLDGSELQFTNVGASYNVSPSGKLVVAMEFPSGPLDTETILNLIDISTGKSQEVSLAKPSPDIELFYPGLQPLSDDKWLTSDSGQDWIYSSDGSVLSSLPENYRVVDRTSPPNSYDLLSPDGTWILVSQHEEISKEQFKVTYRLFDTTDSEIRDLPNLYYISTGMKIVGNRRIDGTIEGCRINRYFWVEVP